MFDREFIVELWRYAKSELKDVALATLIAVVIVVLIALPVWCR